MPAKTYNTLFICTGNSARSIIAEAILNDAGQRELHRLLRWQPPQRRAPSLAVKELERLRIATDRLRSKGWEEFAQSGAPEMDFVFTACDQAASGLARRARVPSARVSS